MGGVESIELEGKGLERFVEYIAQRYGRLAYALIVDNEGKVSPTGSRMGGLPYWDFSREYPKNEQGQPLCFLCQVNLEDIATTPLAPDLQMLKDEGRSILLPEQGLLQFFALCDGHYGCTFSPDNPNCRVVYIEDISHEQGLSMEALKERLLAHGLNLEHISNLNMDQRSGEYWPIVGESAIKFKAVSSLPWRSGDIDQLFEIVAEAALEAFDLDEQALGQIDASDLLEEVFDVPDKVDYVRALSDKERECTIGHLLGYPNFIQETPLYNPAWERFDAVLLCLDRNGKIGDNFRMMWADSGVADFLINGEKLFQQDFSDIFYIWECY